MTVFTIGHSTRPIDEFVAMLREAQIELVADVRSFPRSRTNPQFNIEVLPGSLAAADIGYEHLVELGGRRHRSREAPPSPNTFWQSQAFRNYADYTASDSFRSGFEQLRRLSQLHRCAIMCSEAVWWRCHRRIVADYLLAAGIAVTHILGPHHLEPATPTPSACRLNDGTLIYPASEEGTSQPSRAPEPMPATQSAGGGEP
jgi:uncharacterized protein (DUF488 family)